MLDYTQIALGDMNDNLFTIQFCPLSELKIAVFRIVNRSHPQFIDGQCFSGKVPWEELENQQYASEQPLLYDASRKNRILLSRTDNLLPNFLDELLKYLK